MRIGIFGGTFDPIHKGHLTALENFIKRVSPDKTLIIPAGIPPHKQESATPVSHRVNMIRSAVRGFENAEVCLYEAEKNGKCYTYDTLTYLHGVYSHAEFVMFVGSDMLLSFDRWFKVEEIAKMTSLAVFSRKGDDLAMLENKIRELERSIGLKARLFSDMPMEISSTEIRNAVTCGETTEMILPETKAYIKAKGLYGAEKGFDKESVLEVLNARLNPKRFSHVLGVAQTAVKLAKLWGADVEKAEIAGLLHDCTKDYGYETQLKILEEYGVEAETDAKKEPIIHSVTAPVSAEYDFGVEDAEILSSLRYHTTGRVGMTLLEKIIYVADFIEPTRDYSDVDFYRKKAEEDLDEAIFLQIKWLLKVNTEKNKFIHPESIKIYNSMLENERIKKGK